MSKPAKTPEEHVKEIKAHRFKKGNKHWMAMKLIKLSSGVEQFRMPLRKNTPGRSSMNGLIKEIKKIVADDKSFVRGSGHRVAKSILITDEGILAVLFNAED